MTWTTWFAWRPVYIHNHLVWLRKLQRVKDINGDWYYRLIS